MLPHRRKKVRWGDQHGVPPQVFIVPRKNNGRQEAIAHALHARERSTAAAAAVNAAPVPRGVRATVNVFAPSAAYLSSEEQLFWQLTHPPHAWHSS